MEDLDHCDWKLALQELFQGRDAAAKLRGSLSGVHEDESPAKVHEDLAQMVAGSFTKALSLLGHCDGTASDGTPASSCLSSTDSALPSPKPVVGEKIDGRGRYKRWKSCNSRTVTTPALVDDGHTWRKYGQKPIHGSDFPRSYFRCTHKNDQSCCATKQVQQISRDPPSYETIYYGQHACERTSVPQQVISDGSNLEDGEMFKLISFDQNVPWNTEDHPFFSSIFFSNSCKDEPLG